MQDDNPDDDPGGDQGEWTAVRFDEAQYDLYGARLTEFIARRTELAKAARADGDRALATQIGGLRRPTQSAWAINQWVRTDPDGVAHFLELADELAGAQRRAAAARLRDLSARRQQVLAVVTASVEATARERGLSPSESTLREVSQTLRAALADPEIAETVRLGCLETAAEYSGFGPAGVFAVPDTVDLPDAPDAPDAAALAAAAEAELAARKRLNAVVAKVGGELRAVAALEERLAGLRAEVGRLEDEYRFAKRRLASAEDARKSAQAQHREAVARVERAAE